MTTCSWSAQQQCHATTAAWFALMCLAAQAKAQDQCDGPVLKLLVQVPREPAPRTLYGVLATFGGIPSFNLTPPAPLIAAEPLSGCGRLQQLPGAVYIVERGNCSFVDKYSSVLAAGGSGMILFDDLPGCVNMGGSLTNSSSNSSAGGSPPPQPQPPPPPRNASQPPAISIDRSDGLALLDLLHAGGGGGSGGGASLSLQLQLLDVPALDPSAALLWLMAVGTVVAGGLWSGADYARELKAASAGGGWGGGGGGMAAGAGGGGGLEVLEVTPAGAVGFVAVSSAMLLLLFFFMSRAFFFVILGGFVLAGAQALALLLLPIAAAALPGRLARARIPLPCGAGELSGSELVAGPLALGTALLWAVGRNAAWAWLLQDLLGIAVMLLVLRTLRLPGLRVACVLLPLCLLYDVFWVFIQPALTGGGSSVMVEVASGAGSHEFLPMLLRVPRLSGPPILRGAYSMLGFGDVILPGLLVVLARRLDLAAAAAAAAAGGAGGVVGARASRKCGCGAARGAGYFVPAVLGYACGLLLTYVALTLSWFGDEGQPALLYLVPSTLGTVLAVAAGRGELRALLAADVDGGGCGGHGGVGGGDDEQEEEEQQQERAAGAPAGERAKAGERVGLLAAGGV